jgi:hypothetical protein
MSDAFVADRRQPQVEPLEPGESFEMFEVGVGDLRAVQINPYDFAARIVLDLASELFDLGRRRLSPASSESWIFTALSSSQEFSSDCACHFPFSITPADPRSRQCLRSRFVFRRTRSARFLFRSCRIVRAFRKIHARFAFRRKDRVVWQTCSGERFSTRDVPRSHKGKGNSGVSEPARIFPPAS